MERGLRDLVRQRADDRCEYCRLKQIHQPLVTFHVEHVIPRKHGGSDDEDNLALSCDRCNFHKSSDLSGIDRETGQIVPLFNPRVQTWTDHFELKALRIIGLTPTGRATVDVLSMNAPRRLQLRALLAARGQLD